MRRKRGGQRVRRRGERRRNAQETSGSDGIAADHNRFRVRVTVEGDLQQTGLRGSEGMSEDVRDLPGRPLPDWKFISQRQLVFCQNFRRRGVTYHALIVLAARP